MDENLKIQLLMKDKKEEENEAEPMVTEQVNTTESMEN